MPNKRLRRIEAVQASAYIMPSLIILICFSIVPIIASLFLSFTKYNVLSAPEWISLTNYKNLLNDQSIAAALKNTLIFVIVTVPLQTVSSLLLAELIARVFRNGFGNFVKAALFIPVVASPATIGAVWCMLFAAKGPINLLLNTLGLSSVRWLGNKTLAMLVVCFVSVWKNIGYFLVIFYAGIMDIPRELYEASQIDGASPVQQFLHITIPNLKSVLYLVVTLGTIWAFQEFSLVKIMTDGGPGNATVMLVINIYKAAFKESRMGYASAVAMLLLICILAVSVLQKCLMRGDGGED